MSPYILYSDGAGNIFEDTTLYAAGRSGWDAVPVEADEWIGLPHGGNLYELPGRKGIGIDVKTGQMRLCEKGWARCSFYSSRTHGALHGGLRNRSGRANTSLILLHCCRMV